jgi:hypothetical protein
MRQIWTLLALSLWAGSALSDDPAAGGLPFVEDDYPAALATARARQQPIFIEAWAPW